MTRMRTILVMLAGALIGGFAFAQGQPPIPVPEPRPDPGAAAVASPPEGRTADDLEHAALPRAKGVDASSVCGGRLAKLGFILEPLAPIETGECRIADPVSVTALGNHRVRFTEQAVFNCAMAEKLGLWLRDDVDPAAKRILGGSLKVVRFKGSYKCRRKNWDDDQRLSQHAFGNAVDITGFEIDGAGWITVGQATGRGQQFLKTVRDSACDYFTTVLGPGSNALHADHFHVDLAKRWAILRRAYCR